MQQKREFGGNREGILKITKKWDISFMISVFGIFEQKCFFQDQKQLQINSSSLNKIAIQSKIPDHKQTRQPPTYQESINFLSICNPPFFVSFVL